MDITTLADAWETSEIAPDTATLPRRFGGRGTPLVSAAMDTRLGACADSRDP